MPSCHRCLLTALSVRPILRAIAFGSPESASGGRGRTVVRDEEGACGQGMVTAVDPAPEPQRLLEQLTRRVVTSPRLMGEPDRLQLMGEHLGLTRKVLPHPVLGTVEDLAGGQGFRSLR